MPNFYIQLLNKPQLRIGILLFGPFRNFLACQPQALPSKSSCLVLIRYIFLSFQPNPRNGHLCTKISSLLITIVSHCTSDDMQSNLQSSKNFIHFSFNYLPKTLNKMDFFYFLNRCCEQLLVGRKKQPLSDQAEDLECLCHLIRTCGKNLDSTVGKVHYLVQRFV